MQEKEDKKKEPAKSIVSFLLPFALLPLLTAGGQELHPPTPHRHPEARSSRNPLPLMSLRLKRSEALSAALCVVPWSSGKGDGSMALAGGTPANLTDETWDHGSSDGEIFVVIRDGTSGDMEPYKGRLTEKQLWQLVNYIRSLGPKPEK